MTGNKLNQGRIFLAIGVIFVIGVALMFTLQVCYLMPKLLDVYSEIDPNADQETQRRELQDRMNKVMEDYINETEDGSGAIDTISAVNGGLTALAAFFLTFRIARKYAVSPQQATRYGIAIGAGSVLSLGVCVVCNTTSVPIKLIVLGLLFAAALLGGQLAGQNLALGSGPQRAPGFDPYQPGGSLGSQPFGARPAPGMVSAEPAPDVYYNMGVQAALGGRREEAQQHFKRTLQANPRHIAAWLQLANLAATPEEAWNFVQQARAIDATDPAVLAAVNVVWPQVAARAGQKPPDSGAGTESPEPPAES